MSADVHIRVDLSALLCIGVAAAAVYGAARYLQSWQWLSAIRRHGDSSPGKDETAAARAAQLLQLHYATCPTTAPHSDAGVPAILEASVDDVC